MRCLRCSVDDNIFTDLHARKHPNETLHMERNGCMRLTNIFSNVCCAGHDFQDVESKRRLEEARVKGEELRRQNEAKEKEYLDWLAAQPAPEPEPEPEPKAWEEVNTHTHTQ